MTRPRYRRGLPTYSVGLYAASGHSRGDVVFFRKWQAWLFHLLLNRSINFQGKRDY